MSVMNVIFRLMPVVMLLLSGSCRESGRSAAINPAEEYRLKGIAYLQAQQYPEALEYFIKGMESAKDSRNRHAYISCLGNIGSVYGAMANYERSLYYQNLAYIEAVEAGDSAMASELIVNLVGSSVLAGDLDCARKYIREQREHPMQDSELAEFYQHACRYGRRQFQICVLGNQEILLQEFQVVHKRSENKGGVSSS